MFIKSTFKFFIFITWHKNSSAALMKYVCQDLVHLYGMNRVNIFIETKKRGFESQKIRLIRFMTHFFRQKTKKNVFF
jgi:hypothetical protein